MHIVNPKNEPTGGNYATLEEGSGRVDGVRI